MTPRNSEPDSLALVTGTSSGIGESVARQLVDRGWAVIGLARSAASLSDPRYTHLSVDLSDTATLTALADAEIAPRIRACSWRRLGLVNNAASSDLLGPAERLEPGALARLYAVNVVAPVWLMSVFSRVAPSEAALRIVNVSSGAATRAFPGLAAYGSSKAALRMAGMVLASEWATAAPHAPVRHDAGVLSYEPGAVDTGMQAFARTLPETVMPWGSMFQDFVFRGRLVPPALPAAEIVGFLEAPSVESFSERRLGGPPLPR
jgi:hypothetical protein